MHKPTFVIADPDETYMGFVAEYLRSTNLSASYDFRLFSSVEHYRSFMDSSSFIDILLVSPQFRLADLHTSPVSVRCKIDLIESGMDQKEDQSIYKYQPLHQLFEAVLKISDATMLEGLRLLEHPPSSKAGVFSVYSATGGAGKTVFTLHLGRHLAKKGKKVFYFDMQQHPVLDLLFPSTKKKDAARFFYYLDNKANQIDEWLPSFIATHEETGLDFFDWTFRLEDVGESTSEQMLAILKCLITLQQYDLVLIDMDHALSDKITSVFAVSDEVFWLLTPDVQSFHKTTRLMSEYRHWFYTREGEEHLHMLLNRYTGQLPGELKSFGLNLSAFLPYVPEWKCLYSVRQWFQSNIYMQAVTEACEGLDGHHDH